MATPPPLTDVPLATVRDLLAIDPQRLELIAGAIGLDRPVRWAHSIELIDPRPYLRGHEFVMTMGSALLSDEAIDTFISALLEREASGIGFGRGPVHPSTPTRLKTACDATGLPLIEIAEDVRFMSFTEELAERLAARRVAVHRQDIRREQRLLDLLASGRGLERMLAVVAEGVGGTVAISDVTGSVEVCVGRTGRASVEPIVKRALLGGPPRRPRLTHTNDGLTAELMPIRHAARLLGWLIWLRPSTETTRMAIAILAGAVPILAIELTSRSLERKRERESVGHLISVIRSGVAEPIVLRDRIERAGFASRRIGVAVWLGDGLFEDRQAPQGAIVGESQGMTWFVCPDPGELGRAARDRGVACGIGSVVRIERLRRSIAEAESACSMAARSGGVATWRDLATLPALLTQFPAERLDPFTGQLIVPLVEYDARRRGELLSTLRTFVGLDGSIARTAEALHIHVNTLRYRLERVKAVTGHDPSKFLDRVAFYTALWAWDIGRTHNTGSQVLDDPPVDSEGDRGVA
jgi:hypothetical protein